MGRNWMTTRAVPRFMQRPSQTGERTKPVSRRGPDPSRFPLRFTRPMAARPPRFETVSNRQREPYNIPEPPRIRLARGHGITAQPIDRSENLICQYICRHKNERSGHQHCCLDRSGRFPRLFRASAARPGPAVAQGADQVQGGRFRRQIAVFRLVWHEPALCSRQVPI